MMLYKNELGGDGQMYPFTSLHRQLLVQSPIEGTPPLANLNPDGSYPWEIASEDADTRAMRIMMADELHGAVPDPAGFPDTGGI